MNMFPIVALSNGTPKRPTWDGRLLSDTKYSSRNRPAVVENPDIWSKRYVINVTYNNKERKVYDIERPPINSPDLSSDDEIAISRHLWTNWIMWQKDFFARPSDNETKLCGDKQDTSDMNTS